jgi:hypothetical protein
MRSTLFWDVRQRRSIRLAVSTYQPRLRKTPEERRSHPCIYVVFGRPFFCFIVMLEQHSHQLTSIICIIFALLACCVIYIYIYVKGYTVITVRFSKFLPLLYEIANTDSVTYKVLCFVLGTTYNSVENSVVTFIISFS